MPLKNSNIEVSCVDLTDLESVAVFARKWGKKPIDCIALNAGIQSSVKRRTAQGFEATVGTNHIGHFYLLKLLLPNVKASKSGRVVIVGSGVHNPKEAGGNVGSPAGLGDMSGLQGGFREPCWMIDNSEYDSDKTYKDSKLCNVITCLEQARRLQKERSKVTCNCMNPGLIPTTGLFREFNPIFTTVFSFLTKYVFKVAASGSVDYVHRFLYEYNIYDGVDYISRESFLLTNIIYTNNRGGRRKSPGVPDRQRRVAGRERKLLQRAAGTAGVQRGGSLGGSQRSRHGTAALDPHGEVVERVRRRQY